MALAKFPGRLVKRGEADAVLVTAIQRAMAKRGYGPFTPGTFDARMKATVAQFQAQNTDSDGHALVVDGEVGIYTWGALFPANAIQPSSAPSPLMLQTLAITGTQVGQMEEPAGTNRGPMVDEYLRAAGIDPAAGSANQRAWCAAFVFWGFQSASASLGVPNPLPRTAGCLDHWNRAAKIAGVTRISRVEAYADPALIKPGLVFILDFGQGLGHTGVVETLLPGGRLATVEGNTNEDMSRNGVGVFRLDRRKLSDATLKGFIDYSAVALTGAAGRTPA